MPAFSRPVSSVRLAVATLCTLGLCACATERSAPSEREIAAAQQEAQTLAARGYQPGASASSEHFVEAWSGPDGALMVDVLMPRDAIAAPVVLYLQSPGGPADEGERWRQAWAKAGYAVLSLQRNLPSGRPRAGSAPPGGAMSSTSALPPAPNASMAPSPSQSNHGNAGPANAMAVSPLTHREVDAPMAVAARQALAQFALAEIASRAAQHRAPYDRMDSGHVAVAGFDIGADTALALAGARTRNDADTLVAPPPAVRTVIALAPYVNTTRANPARVYASIALPVLTVSGTADADRHGLVDDPHMRLAPYTYMPAGGKGLLVLDGGLYDTLAGSLRPIEHPPRDQERPQPLGKDKNERGAGGMDRGNTNGGMGGGMGGGVAGGPPGGGRPRGEADQHDAPTPQVEPYAQYVIVEQVTTAYLDAYLKDDPIAQEWLQRNASRWIGPRAQWQMK
jgi:hypothetical protein